MKIISWNVNGLRAVEKKGFLGWLKKSGAEVVCLQEIKAEMDKVPAELINPAGYFSFYNPATKPGYAGTAVFTKQKPLKVIDKIGLERFDNEGRMLRLDFPDFTLINLYLPHGGRAKENLGYKLEVYEKLFNYLYCLSGAIAKSKASDTKFYPSTGSGNKILSGRNIVLIGDFNIAHEEIDLARPKQNTKNIMFTHQERLQLDRLMKMGFLDTFRRLHPKEQKYTWWPYFANARARDLGWRIDYAFASKKLAPKLKKAEIMTDVTGSDHCPIEIDF